MFKIMGNGAFANALKYVIAKSKFNISENDYKYIIPAVPSYAVPEVLKNENLQNKIIIFVSKGLLHDGKLLGEWAKNHDWGVLAGPHFAHEIIDDLETYSIFGYDHKLTEISKLYNMNIEFSPFKLEIQLLGALKNIYACFFGVIDGLQMGQNFSAAMVTFVLNEIKNIFEELKFNTNIIYSQAGIGDLILTCTSKKSRNYMEGLNRVKGISNDNLSEAKHSATAFNKRFGNKHKICDFIHRIIEYNMNKSKITNEFIRLKNEYLK